MTEVVKSLFGIDPQQVLAARDAQMSQQALQFARLSPMQQSQMGIYQGASRLGNAAAGMMGGQDPELQRVSQRNALMQGVDPTNPEHLKAAAMKATEMGDYAAAQEIAARFQALQTASADQAYKRAQVIRALTEAEKATLEKATPEMRNAAAIAAAQTGAQKGSPEFDKAYLETLKELTAKKGDRFGQDNEAEAMATFGKPFGELTQEERRKVIDKVDSSKTARARAGKSEIYLPGQGTAKVGEVSMAENRVNTELKPYRDSYETVDNGLAQIDLNNPKAGAQVDRLLATMSGDKQLSMVEVEAVAKAGSLPQRIVDSFSKFFTGQAGALSTTQKKEILETYRDLVEKRHNGTQERLRKVYRSTDLTPEQVDAIIGSPLKGRSKAPAKGATQKTSKGTNYTIVSE